MAVPRTSFHVWIMAGLLQSAFPAVAASQYDAAVLHDKPSLYLRLSAPSGSHTEKDRSPHAALGTYYPSTASFLKTRLPNGEAATVFDGVNQYLEVPSHSRYSVPNKGALTVEAWVRPDTLDFPADESDGYVHFAGKGESGHHEYALRIYSQHNTASPPRPNRISAYAFNPAGGLGSGSYFQDVVVRGEWIHVAMVIDTRMSSGVIRVFKNGVLRKSTSLDQFSVQPKPGTAPLRIGTRDFGSFFQGAIGKFAIYPRALSASQLRNHFLVMTR